MKRPCLILWTLGLVAFQGCKKDDAASSTLTGHWKLISHANDVNNDNTIQSSELLTLKSNEYGSLDITTQTIKDSAQFDQVGLILSTNLTYLYTRSNDTVSLQGFVGPEPVFKIQNLDHTSLQIKLIGLGLPGQPSEWRFYTR